MSDDDFITTFLCGCCLKKLYEQHQKPLKMTSFSIEVRMYFFLGGVGWEIFVTRNPMWTIRKDLTVGVVAFTSGVQSQNLKTSFFQPRIRCVNKNGIYIFFGPSIFARKNIHKSMFIIILHCINSIVSILLSHVPVKTVLRPPNLWQFSTILGVGKTYQPGVFLSCEPGRRAGQRSGGSTDWIWCWGWFPNDVFF